MDRINKNRVIVCAANRSRKTGQIVCGARHYDAVMRGIIYKNKKFAPGFEDGCDQGFIDQFGTFLNRQEAWKIAEKAGQIKLRFDHDGTLFSENLY